MSSSAAGLCSPLLCVLQPVRGTHYIASSGGKREGREGKVLGSRMIHCNKMNSGAFKHSLIILFASISNYCRVHYFPLNKEQLNALKRIN